MLGCTQAQAQTHTAHFSVLMKHLMINCSTSDKLNGKSLYSQTVMGKKKKTHLWVTERQKTRAHLIFFPFLHNLGSSLNQTQSYSNSYARGTIRYIITICKFTCFLPSAKGKLSSHTWNVNIFSQPCICNLSKWYDKSNYSTKEKLWSKSRWNAGP